MEISEHIIKDCKAGKRDAQKKLYELLAGKMLYVCFRYCKNRDDAEDVMQEGFIKVFRHIDSFKFQGSFEGWVRRIMVNTAINFLTTQKQKLVFDDISSVHAHPEGNEEILTNINQKDLLKILHMLPDGYRSVFNMYVMEGFSHKEIAEILKVSEGTSKSQLSKAKAYLKELLHQYFDADIKTERHANE